MGYFLGILATIIVVVILYHLCAIMRTGMIIKKCATGNKTCDEMLQKTRGVNLEVTNFRRIYREVMHSNQLAQEKKEKFLSGWEKFSLEEILRAKSIEQLEESKKFVVSGTLAARFVPIKHEQISMVEVEVAGIDTHKLILAAYRAPKGGQAEMLAFSKLQRLLSNKQ